MDTLTTERTTIQCIVQLPGISSNPVDQSVFIKVRLMSECNTPEARFRQLLDKVESSSLIVIPLLSNLETHDKQQISIHFSGDDAI